MKIPLKAFILISPYSPYPDESNIKIGGVASSAQHEKASEEDAIVVPLTGSYDFESLLFQLEQRRDDNQTLINYYKQKENPSKHELKSLEEREKAAEYYQKNIDILKTRTIQEFTNLAHFSHQELREFGLRNGELSSSEALRILATGSKLVKDLNNPQEYLHMVNGKLVDQDSRPAFISDFSGFFNLK